MRIELLDNIKTILDLFWSYIAKMDQQLEEKDLVARLPNSDADYIDNYEKINSSNIVKRIVYLYSFLFSV